MLKNTFLLITIIFTLLGCVGLTNSNKQTLRPSSDSNPNSTTPSIKSTLRETHSEPSFIDALQFMTANALQTEKTDKDIIINKYLWSLFADEYYERRESGFDLDKFKAVKLGALQSTSILNKKYYYKTTANLRPYQKDIGGFLLNPGRTICFTNPKNPLSTYAINGPSSYSSVKLDLHLSNYMLKASPAQAYEYLKTWQPDMLGNRNVPVIYYFHLENCSNIEKHKSRFLCSATLEAGYIYKNERISSSDTPIAQIIPHTTPIEEISAPQDFDVSNCH